jgi:PKD repeat protein
MPSFSAVSNAALGSSPITVNIPAGTAAGTYDFNLRVKVASPPPGCESDVVPFTVVVRPQPALAVTASPTSVCPGGTVNLLASPNLSGSGSYAWTSSPSGFTSSIYSPSATPSVATTYTVTYTETSSGCTNSGSVAITMKAVPTVTVNDPSICNGNRAVLTASGASTY